MKKEAFVLGTGIAGISIAEILSRNGYKVFLLEKSNKIGEEASLATQKWFHTGWLYAALPDQSATLGCYDAMKLFNVIYNNKDIALNIFKIEEDGLGDKITDLQIIILWKVMMNHRNRMKRSKEIINNTIRYILKKKIFIQIFL